PAPRGNSRGRAPWGWHGAPAVAVARLPVFYSIQCGDDPKMPGQGSVGVGHWKRRVQAIQDGANPIRSCVALARVDAPDRTNDVSLVAGDGWESQGLQLLSPPCDPVLSFKNVVPGVVQQRGVHDASDTRLFPLMVNVGLRQLACALGVADIGAEGPRLVLSLAVIGERLWGAQQCDCAKDQGLVFVAATVLKNARGSALDVRVCAVAGGHPLLREPCRCPIDTLLRCSREGSSIGCRPTFAARIL